MHATPGNDAILVCTVRVKGVFAGDSDGERPEEALFCVKSPPIPGSMSIKGIGQGRELGLG